MHATPESFGLNQSPLAAVLACARLPYTSALLDSEELRGCKHLPSKLGAFAARVRSTFLRLSTSWSDQFQPRGSRALIRASLSTSRKLSSADCWVSNQPLIVGADQSPPGKPGFPVVRCRALSSEEFRASVILLANPDRREISCSYPRESAPRPGSVSRPPLHVRSSRTSQPAAAIRWEP